MTFQVAEVFTEGEAPSPLFRTFSTVLMLAPPNFFWGRRDQHEDNLEVLGRYLANWPHSGLKRIFRVNKRQNFEIDLLLEFLIFLQTVFCNLFTKGLSTK